MNKKRYNITDLKTIHNFAAAYKSKKGGVGVSRQYIETLIRKGKNHDFELVKIDGIKFIYPKIEELIDEDYLQQAERTARGKIIRQENEAYTSNGEVVVNEEFIIDQTTYPEVAPVVKPKEKPKPEKKEIIPPNQLSLF